MKRLITSVFLILITISTYTLTSNVYAATYNIVADVCDGVTGTGTISPSGTTSVDHNGTQIFTFTPATGYEIEEILVDGNPVVNISNPYPFSNVIEDHTICVRFKKQTFTIEATAGPNGTIAPAGTTTYNYGDFVTFTITPDTDFEIATFTVNAADAIADLISNTTGGFTYEKLATAPGVVRNHTIEVTFSAIVYDSFTVTPTFAPVDGIYGSVTPSTPQKRRAGESVTFDATTLHIIDTIIVDDVVEYAWDKDPATIIRTAPTGLLTFENLAADHEFYVKYERDLGISEDPMPTLTVTPTPTTGKVNVEYGENIINKLEIVNAMGDIVMIINNPNSSLDITSIPTGTYFLRFYTDKSFTNRKIVKN